MSPRIAVFPGFFDPFTKGHEDIVRRASHFFDHIVIGIGHNSKKQRFFPVELMLDCIRETFADTPNVSVEAFQGLTAVFARKKGAQFLLRGLRNTTDFEYENSIAQVNRKISPGLETVLLITSPHLAYISSSLVRDIYRYGQNIDEYLPYSLEAVMAKYGHKPIR
ncbi:MAG: pantetheine-phosphate adenylyltransferase [Cytophagales bacterium]|nr:pantetheine-phosphate adenylyltransferase [Bernardetiaceae bacterium]MDW8210470.1 pantetheine-phosphate adenylyltransferase [Cytophagales bacterium]